jgi:hypothetical protein
MRLVLVIATFPLLSGCPGPQGPCVQPKSLAEQQICANCTTNLDVAKADLKQCAGSAASCDGLKKDLAQLEQVSPPDQQNVSEVRGHLGACRGKGENDPECKSAQESLNKIQCK